MDSMFDTLMGLPLFKGVSRQRMAEIVGLAKFHFLKYLPGVEFVAEGDPCTHLKFLLAGSARVTTANADRRFRVSQTLEAPAVIAPDFLFGRHTVYPCSAKALTPLNILQITKSDYLKILNKDEIFMLNYLNLLSTNAQKAIDGVMSITSGSIEERIALWIICLTQPGATDIVLGCRQRDLYSVFGVQRSSFMAALDDMRARGLIEYSANEIRILSRRDINNLLATGDADV